jgi:hypothetical protein
VLVDLGVAARREGQLGRRAIWGVGACRGAARQESEEEKRAGGVVERRNGSTMEEQRQCWPLASGGGWWCFVDKVLVWIDMGCEPTGPHWPSTISPLFSFPFFSFFFPRTSLCLHNLCFSIALLKYVWRRLTGRFMRLGGWKGVERLALPCRLKNIETTSPHYHLPLSFCAKV